MDSTMEVVMSDNVKFEPPVAVKKGAGFSANSVKKPEGTIVYNPYLDSWRCINAQGKMVLSTGSKASAKRAYPTFVVKEK